MDLLFVVVWTIKSIAKHNVNISWGVRFLLYLLACAIRNKL
jgi:hypothetical protein